jgi:hypothetical protein
MSLPPPSTALSHPFLCRRRPHHHHQNNRPAGGIWSDYDAVVADVTATGFDRVASVYEGNLGADLEFSHNPDWMIATTLTEIDSAVADETPFFLYYVGDVFSTASSQKVWHVSALAYCILFPECICRKLA